MADEPKWTPGPWANHQSHIYAPDGALIAVVRNPGSKAADYPLVANRDLMTAAPDMYAALDDLLASYAEPDQQICCGGHGCGCRGASVRDLAEHHARTAIAKARGAA